MVKGAFAFNHVGRGDTFNVLSTFVAAFIYFSLLACTPQASAQAVATGGGAVHLANLVFDERTSGGKLNACELVYLIAYEDHIYRRGDAVFLRGAVNMFDAGPGKGVGLGIKITMFDAVGETPKLAPIGYAYLSANGQSYAGKELTKGNAEDGGVILAYDIMALPTLYAALLTGSVEFNFNRNVGASDVAVPVNLFQKHPEIAIRFNECSTTLLEGVLSRLQ